MGIKSVIAGMLAVLSFNAFAVDTIDAEVYEPILHTYQLEVGQCASVQVNIFGITRQMVVVVSPDIYPGPVTWIARVVSANTVEIRVCALEQTTPLATSYRIKAL